MGTTARIRDEGLREPERFRADRGFAAADARDAIGAILEQIDANLPVFTGSFPAPACVGNVYPAIDNTEWTSAFWTGMLWLAYEESGSPAFMRAAASQLGSYEERIDRRMRTDTHDLGFLYSLSCVAAFKLTGSTDSRMAALRAAELLAGRFLPKAGIVQAWGDLDDPAQRGRMIIDCCMNMPLLHWASAETGDRRYAEMALSHTRKAMEYLVRDDASSFHTYFFDAETGKPRYGNTAQGLSDDSCWARGQAWGIYGFALGYRYSHDPEVLDIACRMGNYFLNRLPEDLVCYWDLSFTDGPEERDSSAAAIAACGLLEIAGSLPESDTRKTTYADAAASIAASLAKSYASRSPRPGGGVLLHAVYSKPAGEGVDECCIWGDYFYFEALVRLTRSWTPYW
jgi:unsaturated chondroitin disaccharide hydrolase